MQECITPEVVESCNNCDDDDNVDGDVVESNYTSQCEPIADFMHVERIEKPVLYTEMEEHDAPYIRAIRLKKESTSVVRRDSSNITVETDKLHSNLCEEEDGNYRTTYDCAESRPHYNLPYVSLVEHKWRNQTVKWKLPLSEREHERKELQSLLIHKGKKIGPMIATERHLASFSVRELSHKKPNTEPMEITKWSQVALPERRHTASTEPTNMFVPKHKKERHVTYKENKAGNGIQQEKYVISSTKEFAYMTVMKHEPGCARDANYCNENNSNKVTVSRIGNYGSKNICNQGIRACQTDNTKQTNLLSTSNNNTHTTITATKEPPIIHEYYKLKNCTNTENENHECRIFDDVTTHKKEITENVMLHIYDLSKGVMAKYSKLALGEFSPAIYHSGVVCFGKEFIFEGGIAMWRAGQTRFGNKFAVVNAGHTTKSLKEFLEWIQERELSVYQLSDYDVARHNCHHFTRSAVHFLTNNRSTVPSYLFNTIEVIRRSIIGAAMLEVVSLLTCSFQYIATKQQHSRLIERLIACDVLTNASVVCEVNTLPPCMCVLFRLSERVSLENTFEAMEPYIEHLLKRRKISDNAKIMYNCFVKRLLASSDDPPLTSTHMESLTKEEESPSSSLSLPSDTTEFALLSNFVDMIVKVLMENDETLWGPVLNVLRVALLDLNVCVECASHKWLIPLLLHAANHFTRLVPIVKLALLRVLCNLASFGHGAIVLRDEQYVSVWISAVGMALCDCSPAIVYSAACLSLNITMALITVSVQSLRNEIKHYNIAHKIALASASSNTALNNNINKTTSIISATYKESTHPIYRLITIILYHLGKTKVNEMHEASRNMLLHSLMRLMSANGSLLNFTVHHTLQVKCDELISISSTNDSRALLCIIKALHVLHRK